MNTNIKSKYTKGTKYTINSQFFKNPELWEQEQAYFLGWLASDGSIDLKNNRISLKLQERDKGILEILKGVINYSGPLLFSKRNRLEGLVKKYAKTFQNRWGLVFTNKEIHNDLIKIGLNHTKSSTLTFPICLKPSLLPHFLRGFYEGDGTMSYSYNNNLLRFEINLIGRLEFCEVVKNILEKELGAAVGVVPAHRCNNGHVTIRMQGNLNALRFFNFIYKDAKYMLKRKFKKFLRLINWKKRHFTKRTTEKELTELEKAKNLAKHLIQTAQY